MRLWHVAVLCVLAGCDALFGLDHLNGNVDAAVPNPDAGDPLDASCLFGPGVTIQTLAGGRHPSLTVDRLELFFVFADNGNPDIRYASRISVTELFDMSGGLAGLSSPGPDLDPALTGDGLMIVFLSNRGTSGLRAYQAMRTETGSAFQTAVMVPGLDAVEMFGLDLSPDGLTLYYDDGNSLLQASRPSTGAPFEPAAVRVAEFRAESPSVSPDGLTLFYNRIDSIEMVTRADTMSMFDQATAVIVGPGSDADLLADGSALVLADVPSQGRGAFLREACR